MPKISRRRYFKLLERIIIDHCCDFYGQPNYSLMRGIAESERQNRMESWPRPLGIMYHMIAREVIHEIQQEVLDQFPADAFAGPPVPARPINPVAGYTSPKAMEDLPAHIGFWDPLYLYREHLELLRNLHTLERRYLGRPDPRVLA
ncbi:hypothetical protein [Paraburkholderia phenazinium]|uniref:hypothetical protein n=1 Tax=Paraburkholderia phenazinium TaxID=60549 RepID=UPI00158BEF14|nr:hypothetical protein [Paraburkholderia phenazinium]